MVPRLKLTGITKRYSKITANENISLEVEPGEILAILGENGAGKSTLMKIIFGSVEPDAGSIEFDGQTVKITSPSVARSLGIAMVFQHFVLFDTLTVAENILLGLSGSWDLAKLRQEILQKSQHYGLDVNPEAIINDLSMGERQRVEILRALLTNPKLLILDEPTSVLSPLALKALFQTLKQLADEGVSIVFITHKLNEIRELADRCTVIRAGRVIASVNPREFNESELARLMIGDEMPEITPREAVEATEGLYFQFSNRKVSFRSPYAINGSLNVKGGSIVGVAGISGNGQSDLMSLLSGEVLSEKEAVKVVGQHVGDLTTKHRRALGLRYVPEQRLGHATVPEMSLESNTLLTSNLFLSKGFMRNKMIRRFAERIIREFSVKCAGSRAHAKSLSGGNLQKFIVGREITHNPPVLIVNQPTWGVDAGAATLIRNALITLRGQGAAILVISEELDELFEISDEMVVMSQGFISPQVVASRLSVDEVGRWMSGMWPGGPSVPSQKGEVPS